MALNRIKNHLTRIALTTAVLISLSGKTAAEPRRCYWCGPLAEQVHRSQRAPSCNDDNVQVTVCDEGFSHCAVVATAPPHIIESRYCVKFYQDECYPLYCNSTRTWRMTCPCQGDLCNGPNTERENEAFVILAKLVAKTQNIRMKRTPKTSNFFSTNRRKMNNTVVDEYSNMTIQNNDTSGDLDLLSNEVPMNDITSEIDNTMLEKQVDETMDKPEMVEKTSEMPMNDAAALDETVQTGTPENENIITSPGTVTQDIANMQTIINTEADINNDQSNTQIQIDIPSPEIESSDLKTEIIIMSSESPKMNDNTNNNMAGKVPEIVKTTPGNAEATIEVIKTTMEARVDNVKTSLNENKLMDKSKTSEKLPPAEALQHNDTPAVKATESTSVMTNTMGTSPVMDASTPTMGPVATMTPKNNTATRLDTYLLVPLFIGVILQN